VLYAPGTHVMGVLTFWCEATGAWGSPKTRNNAHTTARLFILSGEGGRNQEHGEIYQKTF
jgi:hypothetical protein